MINEVNCTNGTNNPSLKFVVGTNQFEPNYWKLT